MMDIKVRRGLRVARFRPRFEGDNPVAAPDQIYRHTFTYYPHPEGTASGKKGDTPTKKSTTAPKGEEPPAPEETATQDASTPPA